MEGETHRATNVDGKLYVPYLINDGDKVILNWNWLDNDWNANNPALRFASHFTLFLKADTVGF